MAHNIKKFRRYLTLIFKNIKLYLDEFRTNFVSHKNLLKLNLMNFGA